MANRVNEKSDHATEAKVLSDAEQERQEHRTRDALEDDEVMEALKRLHHDRDAGQQY